MRHKSYNSYVAFLDMLFNALLVFAFMFIISWLLINPINDSSKKIEAKGEFIITVTWPDLSKDDVDLWVQDPSDRVVFFGYPQVGMMHLDRDDLGLINDTIMNTDGTITEIHLNREVVTIRGIEPGEYVVNVVMYRKSDPEPIKAKVEVIKVNPYEVVTSTEVELSEKGDEETIIRFTLNNRGDVIAKNRLPKKLTD